MDPLDVRASAIAQVQVGDPDICRSVARWPLDPAADNELDRLRDVVTRWPAQALPDVLASIRSNPALTELGAYNVRGLRDDSLRLIAEALPGMKQLVKIDLRHNGELTDAGVRMLLPPLPGSGVTSVRLDGCDGVSASARAEVSDAVLPNILAPVRANDAALTILCLRDVNLRDEQVAVVVDALADNLHAVTLDLRSNPALTDAGARQLLPLPGTCALTEICLAGCDGISAAALGDVAAAFVGKRLSVTLAQLPPTATELALRAMGLRDEHVATIVETVLINTSLQKLDLAQNLLLTDAGAHALVPALASAVWLREIDMRGCRGVSAAAAAAVQDACISNRLPVLLEAVSSGSVAGPRVLDLWQLGLQDKHVSLLSEALSGNAQLQTVDLSDNVQLTDAGLLALVPALGKCRVGEVLMDGCNGISEAARMEIRDACLPNRLSSALAAVRINDKKTTVLNLSAMDLWDEALGLVAEALMGNEHVRRLELGANADLTDEGARLLLPSIPSSRVVEIDLVGCPAVSNAAKHALCVACLPNILVPVAENDASVRHLNLFKLGLEDEHMDLVAAALTLSLVSSSRPPTGDADDDGDKRPGTSGSGRPGTSSSGGSAWLRRAGNLHVDRIDLRWNTRLTDAGVRLLVPAIAASRVQDVDLSECPAVSGTARAEIWAACVKNALAPVHANEPSTTSLKLQGLGLRDKDMDVVSQALAENEHVTALDLRGNGQLTAAGVRKVLRVLRESKVESIELGGCFGVSEQAKEETRHACGANVRRREML